MIIPTIGTVFVFQNLGGMPPPKILNNNASANGWYDDSKVPELVEATIGEDFQKQVSIYDDYMYASTMGSHSTGAPIYTVVLISINLMDGMSHMGMDTTSDLSSQISYYMTAESQISSSQISSVHDGPEMDTQGFQEAVTQMVWSITLGVVFLMEHMSFEGTGSQRDPPA